MKRSLGLACALIVTACTTPGEVQRIDSDLVRTTSGSLRGSVDDGVRVYRGVPYAQPPVGEGRWAAPRTPRWEGVRDAFAFGPACLQPINADGSPNFGGYHGPVSEDCLTLNIWAPKTGTKAPIMLWLFGGGGVVGAGSLPTYNGTAFARDGVILVTINYRLGGLGGFAHPALTREKNGGPNANYALLDAIAALRWVKENAEAFGGDPDNITLFGESAGATMTANLVTSPMAKGLFGKAIIESTGSLPTPATPLAKAEAIGAKMASDLGLPGANATSAQLRALDARRFLEHKIGGFGFRTISDGVVQPGSIMDAFEQRAQNDVMLMLGTNSDEGRLAGTQRVAALAEKRRPVFHYFFDYVPSALRSEHPNGAPHAGELPFVFDTLDSYAPTEGKIPTEEDRNVARLVHSCWVAFAKAATDTRAIDCGGTFRWPARSPENEHAAAWLKPIPALIPAETLRSPPNGAEPGKTSRP